MTLTEDGSVVRRKYGAGMVWGMIGGALLWGALILTVTKAARVLIGG